MVKENLMLNISTLCLSSVNQFLVSTWAWTYLVLLLMFYSCWSFMLQSQGGGLNFKFPSYSHSGAHPFLPLSHQSPSSFPLLYAHLSSRVLSFPFIPLFPLTPNILPSTFPFHSFYLTPLSPFHLQPVNPPPTCIHLSLARLCLALYPFSSFLPPPISLKKGPVPKMSPAHSLHRCCLTRRVLPDLCLAWILNSTLEKYFLIWV